MTFILGLTGSIGMGKSATAKMFADEGVPVHDADAVVHRLYEGEATPLIEAAFPGTTSGGKVDRGKLGRARARQADAIKRLEQIVHPLVTKAREHFLAEAGRNGAAVAVLDVPLLYETGGDEALRRSGGGIGARRDAARAGLRASRHDGREIGRDPGQANAGCGKARPRRFRGGYVERFRCRPRPSA